MLRIIVNGITALMLGLLVFVFIVVCLVFGGCSSPPTADNVDTEKSKENLRLHRELDRVSLQYWNYRERYLWNAWLAFLSDKITVHTYEKIVLCVIEDYDRKMQLVRHDREHLLGIQNW